MVKVNPEQNQVTTVARRNHWDLSARGGYVLWSKAGRQVMLSYDKDSGDITSAWIDGIRVGAAGRLSKVLTELIRR